MGSTNGDADDAFASRDESDGGNIPVQAMGFKPTAPIQLEKLGSLYRL